MIIDYKSIRGKTKMHVLRGNGIVCGSLSGGGSKGDGETAGERSSPLPGCGGVYIKTERVEGTTGERRRTYWDGGNGGRTQFTHTARNIHVGGEGQRANAEERTGTGNGGRTKFTHTGVRGSLCQPNA